MFRVILIGGGVFWAVAYVAARYAHNKLEQKQNPLQPFASGEYEYSYSGVRRC